MTNEQINTLGRYLGCECEYTYLGKREIKTLDVYALRTWSENDCSLNFNLHLKPLSSLTQEDFKRMFSEISYDANSDLERWIERRKGRNHLIFVEEADWLRNNSYYLGEKSIKEFVKIEELTKKVVSTP